MKNRLLKYTMPVIVLLLMVNTSKSQVTDSIQNININNKPGKKQGSVMLFLLPQYLFVDGIRMDVDLRRKGKKAWWVISPYYYNSNKNTLNIIGGFGKYDRFYDKYDYNDLKGVGLGISRKQFLSGINSETGFHFKYGGVYRYYNVFGNSPTYQEFVGDDNLTYLELRETDYTIIINNFQLKAEMGYQYETRANNLFFDFYIGFAASLSSHHSSENVNVKFERSKLDYGYSGIQFIAGIRFGVKL